MATSAPVDTVQIECPSCGKVHRDANYARCVSCGVEL